MPKVLQMPKPDSPKRKHATRLPKLLAAEVESEQQEDPKIHKWLELGDAALRACPKVEIIVPAA